MVRVVVEDPYPRGRTHRLEPTPCPLEAREAVEKEIRTELLSEALAKKFDVQVSQQELIDYAIQMHSRIEEEVIVTDKGCQIISLFPAEELPIANRY